MLELHILSKMYVMGTRSERIKAVRENTYTFSKCNTLEVFSFRTYKRQWTTYLEDEYKFYFELEEPNYYA